MKGFEELNKKYGINIDEPTNPFEQKGNELINRYKGEQRTLGGTLGDIGISALKGAISVPESAVGLADIATGGRAGKAAESLGFRPKEAREYLGTLYSPAQQKANTALQEAEGFIPSLGASIQNPSTILHSGIESVPLMLGGGAIGQGVRKFAPAVSPFIAGGIGEGVVSAGSSAEAIRQQTDDGLLTPKQAILPALSGAATGIIGGGMGKLASRYGINDPDILLAGGGKQSTKALPRRVAEGALSESAEELPQSAQEQALQNIALDNPIGEGVGQAAAQGLLVGGIMGGAGGIPRGPLTRAVQNTAPQEEPPIPDTPVQPTGPQPAYSEETLSKAQAMGNMGANTIKLATQNNVPEDRVNKILDYLNAEQKTASKGSTDEQQITPDETPDVGISESDRSVSVPTTGEKATVADQKQAIVNELTLINEKVDDPKAKKVIESDIKKINGAKTIQQLGNRKRTADQRLSKYIGNLNEIRNELTGSTRERIDATASESGQPGTVDTGTTEPSTLAGSGQDALRTAPQTDAELPATGDRVEAGSGEAVKGSISGESTEQLTGEKIDKKWTRFSDDSGSLNIPRNEMPQVKAEHRGALVNFLNAKGVNHEKVIIPSNELKPTQAEFSPAKVEKAKKYTGGDRSILVSSDNHVVDGHHQWMAKLDSGEDVNVIKLDAPINKILKEVKQFPSVEQSDSSKQTPPEQPTAEITSVPKTQPVQDEARTGEPIAEQNKAMGESVQTIDENKDTQADEARKEITDVPQEPSNEAQASTKEKVTSLDKINEDTDSIKKQAGDLQAQTQTQNNSETVKKGSSKRKGTVTSKDRSDNRAAPKNNELTDEQSSQTKTTPKEEAATQQIPHLSDKDAREVLTYTPEKLKQSYIKGRFQVTPQQADEIIDAVQKKTTPVTDKSQAKKSQVADNKGESVGEVQKEKPVVAEKKGAPKGKQDALDNEQSTNATKNEATQSNESASLDDRPKAKSNASDKTGKIHGQSFDKKDGVNDSANKQVDFPDLTGDYYVDYYIDAFNKGIYGQILQTDQGREYSEAAKIFLGGELSNKQKPKKLDGILLLKELDGIVPKSKPKRVKKVKNNFDNIAKSMLPFAGNKDVRYYLNGVVIDDIDNKMIAANGHTLAIIKGIPSDAPIGNPYYTQDERDLDRQYPAQRNGYRNIYSRTAIEGKLKKDALSGETEPAWIDGKLPAFYKVQNEIKSDKTYEITLDNLSGYASGVSLSSKFIEGKYIKEYAPITITDGKITHALSSDYAANAANLLRSFGYDSANITFFSKGIALESKDGKIQVVVLNMKDDSGKLFKPYDVKQADYAGKNYYPTPSTMRVKEDADVAKKQDKPKFSKSQQTTGSTVNSIKEAIRKELRRAGNLLDNGQIEVVQSVKDLPSHLRDNANALFHTVWHGSPHDFDKFSLEHIGKGEGAQAYGHGLYFADSKEVAEWYKENLGKVKLLLNGKELIPTEWFGDAPYISEEFENIIPERFTFNAKLFNGKSAKKLIRGLAESFDLMRFTPYGEPFITEIDEWSNNPLEQDFFEWVKSQNPKSSKGTLYQVELAPTQDEYLLWDKPLSEQSEKVGKGIRALKKSIPKDFISDIEDRLNADFDEWTGGELYKALAKFSGESSLPGMADTSGNYEKDVSDYLHSLGIRGIKYLDGTSRSQGEGAYNYVIFSEDDVSINEKFSKDLSDVEGLFDPKTGKIYMVADMLDDSSLRPVLLHELFHRSESTDTKLQAALPEINKQLNGLYDAASRGRGAEIIQKAYRRVVEAKTPKKDRISEFGAYLISEYERGNKSLPERVVKWIKDLYAAIRAALIRAGMVPKNITPADLSALARASLRGKSVSQEIAGDTVFKSVAAPVQSSLFKRWFRQSKMVSGGKPIKFYHGTNADFTVFDKGKLKSSTLHATASLGHFFTRNKDEAYNYGKNVHEVYLSVQKPYVTTSELLDKRMGEDPELFKRRLIRDGYDGIWIKDAGYAVAFESNQVKLTSNESPTFSDDIRFSKAQADDDLNKRIREQHKTFSDKAKQLFKKEFLPGGLLPKEVFDLKITRDSEMNAEELIVHNMVAGLERAVKAEYGVKFNDIDKAIEEKITARLKGEETDLPQNIKDRIDVMRKHIDKLSLRYANTLFEEAKQFAEDNKNEAAAAKVALLNTIAGNIGKYVNRSYRAFDDKNWPKKVPDDVLNNAREYFVKRFTEQGSEDAVGDAQIVIEDILKDGTAYDSFEQYIKESKLGAKDLSTLKHKKDISPEVRALLGEYTDPRVNFVKSATKMSRLVFNDDFLKKVKEIGLGNFLFEKNNRPSLDRTVKIASEGDSAFSPLNGLYTYPEVHQAFIDALGREKMEQWYKFIVQTNGLIKYGKTVLSPTTSLRNWMSAYFFTMANGHFDMSHMKESIESFRTYFDQDDGRLNYLTKLKRLGVIYDTPYAGEMMKLLEDSKFESTLIGDESKSKKTKAKLKVKELMDIATKFYQFGDDFWKVIGFENEKQLLIKYRDMSESEAEIEAAKRIRDTYPTYSMVGRMMQKLRRFPLVGTFVSFPSEIVRTSLNILKYAKEDMAHSKELGRRRLTGLAMASGMAFAAQSVAKMLVGMDDDDEEALRDLAPPWSKNSNIIPLWRDQDGSLVYMDMSFLDPYNYWKRPINALLRDEPIDEKIREVGREVLSPFFGQDIAFGAIMDIWQNKKDSGGRVFNPHESSLNISLDIANHLRKNLQPGAASNLERLANALTGHKSSSGQVNKVSEELAALVGFRVSRLNPKVALYYKAFEFQDKIKDATRILSDVARDPNKVGEGKIKSSLERARQTRLEAFKDMNELVNAARKSGLSDGKIRQLLRLNRISSKDISSIMRGTEPKWNPTNRFLMSSIKRADDFFDSETKQSFIDRRNLVLK